jgi:hypothetical protein
MKTARWHLIGRAALHGRVSLVQFVRPRLRRASCVSSSRVHARATRLSETILIQSWLDEAPLEVFSQRTFLRR